MAKGTDVSVARPLDGETAPARFGNKAVPLVPQDFPAVMEVAHVLHASGMAPRDFNNPQKICVAIMHGLEVGMPPMMALQTIAVVNGRPSLFGDGALALVRASGLLHQIAEEMEREGPMDPKDPWKGAYASCTVKRTDDPKARNFKFSVSDAKRAGLWGKSGPWTQYPKRMLAMRARAYALRDVFPDVLRGLRFAEELVDVQRQDEAAAVESLIGEGDTQDVELPDAIDVEAEDEGDGADPIDQSPPEEEDAPADDTKDEPRVDPILVSLQEVPDESAALQKWLDMNETAFEMIREDDEARMTAIDKAITAKQQKIASAEQSPDFRPGGVAN